MTLGELKMRKAELRNRMDKEKPYILLETVDEYNKVLSELGWLERRLLKPIVISIIAVLLFVGGCNIMRETLHLSGAACQDAGWLLQKGADNIKTQEK